MPTAPRVNASLDSLATLAGVHAQQLADVRSDVDDLDDRMNTVSQQIAVWRGQLRLVAILAGSVAGIVGTVTGAVVGAIVGN